MSMKNTLSSVLPVALKVILVPTYFDPYLPSFLRPQKSKGSIYVPYTLVYYAVIATEFNASHFQYSWLPDVFRLKGSIIKRIIGPVLTVTLFAALVAYASSKGHRLMLSNSIVPMLSVVVGLILVFRNSTSYDRYWEGRKSFSQVTSNARNLARQLWVNVAPPPIDGDPTFAKGKTPALIITPSQLRKRKIEALQLCLSFVYATKHYLRGEDGMGYADYQGVLPASFGRFDEPGYSSSSRQSRSQSRQRTYDAISHSNVSTSAITTNGGSIASVAPLTESAQNGRSTPDGFSMPKPDATKRVRVKRSKPQVADSVTPLLGEMHQSVEIQPSIFDLSMPLPLIIAHELSRILFSFRKDGLLETVGPAGTNQMNQLIAGLVDQLTAMERVANTPIPASYGIHLKQCVTLYLFALPLTLINELGWATIPIVTVVAFTFMGIEGIADEIEMPFGTDERDLPLDRYCEDLKEEIDYIMHHLPDAGDGTHVYDDGEGDD
ncbi:hypothetical protein AMATHDRAFT_2116 [Amanita thiersii Skay4041]|uniref:Uncharacterized protein n=1 Tax=Amanita thiersii Skay4041 TaxID=703135 RepID=A0A2A9NVP6_9AGAR|nr:hypothetical protein AMATHDRAFT_2116 [Amanita thiersii Skay4041]